MEQKLKHLEFIQSTINRMANNSFLLKGWAVSLSGAVFALSFKELDPRYIYISLVIIGLFWVLDGYYLAIEKNFIRLYDHTRKKFDAEIDFSMDANKFSEEWGWCECVLSKTLILFYGGLFAVALVINHYLV